MKKIDWLVIIFIVIVSVIALKDLFKPYFYTSHDGIHQVVRLFYFDQSLRDGEIPPRWVGGLLNGFGYPLFEFSYHLPWFIAEPFYLAGLSIFDSIKTTFLLGFAVSGITMYLFQKEVFGRFAGFAGTIIYLFAPFRFSNIFVRAAIGDATVFIFPPFFFLSLFKLRKAKKLKWSWIVLAAVSLSSMLLSHAMVAMFYFFCFGLYVLYRLIFYRNKKLILISSIVILLLSFGLSSYYLIPSLIERDFTKFAEIMGPAYMDQNFLKLSELIYSPWGYGTVDAKEGAMSLQIGIAQWISVFTAFGALVVLRWPKDIPPRAGWRIKEGLFFFLIFILSILSMVSISSPFWQVVKKFVVIDFPWRILSLTVFVSSVLAGFAISMVRNKILKFLVAFFLITLSFYANRNHLRINQVLSWPLNFYLKLEKTTNSHDEYIPKWVNFDTEKKALKKVEFSSGDAKVDIDNQKSNYLSFTIDAPKDGIARINTIYYPGWQVIIDGKPSNIKYDNGLIEFEVPKGKSRVISQFKETPLRKASDLLSLTTVGVIVLGFVKYVIPPRKSEAVLHRVGVGFFHLRGEWEADSPEVK